MLQEIDAKVQEQSIVLPKGALKFGKSAKILISGKLCFLSYDTLEFNFYFNKKIRFILITKAEFACAGGSGVGKTKQFVKP